MTPVNYQLYQGDCLTELARVPDASVNLILADLPYGTTACSWDSVIPLEPLWAHFRRILAPRGAVVLTASQPFTTTLISSNRAWFRYTWVWDKGQPNGFLNAKRIPLKQHEDVCVFYPKQPTYNPQFIPRAVTRIDKARDKTYGQGGSSPYGVRRAVAGTYTEYYPRTILRIPNANQAAKRHPTEKPLPLMEYIVKTYSNPGDVVCDPTMGSGTTGEAAINLDRVFIGIELDPGYFAIAERRIEAAAARARQGTLEGIA